MQQFDTIEKAMALFQSVNGLGQNNNIIVTFKDLSMGAFAAGGLVGAMISQSLANFQGLLLNLTENGLGMFFLGTDTTGLSAKIEKYYIQPGQYYFVPSQDIAQISMKNYAPLNPRRQKIRIEFTDGTVYKLYANVNEKFIPYQAQNMANWMQMYRR